MAMLITNQTTFEYWFGPLRLAAGVGETLAVDDTSDTSLYLTSDEVADSINSAYAAGKITVTGAASPFPRPTGTPDVLHGDGAPEGMVYGGQGSIYLRRDNGTVYSKTSGVHLNTGWVQLSAGEGVPSGTIMPYGGSSAPGGYLICDGSAVNRVQYTDLFNAIGTTFGSGDGSTTFNIPDLRSRVAVGVGTNVALASDDGVSEASRRGTKHRHSPHTHGGAFPSSGGSFGVVSGSGGGKTSGNIGTADGGSGNAGDPLDGPAFLGLNFIIKV